MEDAKVRRADHRAFLHRGIRQVGDRHLEQAAVLHDRIDMRLDRATVGGLIGRDFGLGLGRK